MIELKFVGYLGLTGKGESNLYLITDVEGSKGLGKQD